jgi:hypothetical protein
MGRCNPAKWQRNPCFATQTSLQVAIVRFGTFLNEARLELSEREYDALVSIVTARIAGEHRLRLDREEFRRRRAA